MKINKRYCVFIRELLFTSLGRRCWNCGSIENLTFDLRYPKVGPKYHHSRMSWRQRVNYYWSQFEQNNLQILCLPCNSSKKDKNFIPKY